MLGIHLDENLSGKKLQARCRSDGLSKVWRVLPEDKGNVDNDVLKYASSSGLVLVTGDRKFALQVQDDALIGFPGLIIVSNASPESPSMGTKRIVEVLAPVKSVITDWTSVDLKDSVVLITDEYIEVQHLEDGSLVSDCIVELDEDGISELEQVIQGNAKRGAS